MSKKHTISAILGDWGTSSLRLWAVDQTGSIVSQQSSDQGVTKIESNQFESLLQIFMEDNNLVALHTKLTVVLCGMAGAKIGWIEVPYLDISEGKTPNHLHSPTLETENFNVWILPGLKQQVPAEVMRGEETQINGFLSEQPAFSGVLCLPGTHSKWVKLENGSIQQFKTVMTGELFSLLKDHSTLSAMMENYWSDDAFFSGVKKGFENAESLTSLLFSARANTLVHGTESNGFSLVSGLLVGAELSSVKTFIKNQPFYLIGDGKLIQHYSRAGELLGFESIQVSGTQMAFNGLLDSYQKINNKKVKHG